MPPTTIRLLPLLLLLAFPGCDDPAGESGDSGPDATPDTGDELMQTGDPVRGLDITQLAIYQAVKIPLMQDGAEAGDWPVPLVAGRDALLRVSVERHLEWAEHTIAVVVQMETSSGPVEPLQLITTPTTDSLEQDLGSTLNVNIPGSRITAGTRISVSLEEWSGGMEPIGEVGRTRWPAEGMIDLPAEDPGGPLEVVLVPVRYWGDESGRLPDTTEPQVMLYEELAMSQYPAAEVDITVAEPFDWHGQILWDGTGWSALLDAIAGLRNTNGAEPQQYYYGIFEPDETFGEYCQGGCVAGLSYLVQNPADHFIRASIGLGYYGESATSTMVHELGHAHGRMHAPCGVSDPDMGYPHPGGVIGSWGYDLFERELFGPSQYYDFMSYCNPVWISDYTYDALFTRIRAVNALAGKRDPGAPQQAYATLSIDMHGAVTRGPNLDLDVEPRAEPRTVELLDAGGTVRGTAAGQLFRHGDPSGGLVIFPEPSPGVTHARLAGHPPVALH